MKIDHRLVVPPVAGGCQPAIIIAVLLAIFALPLTAQDYGQIKDKVKAFAEASTADARSAICRELDGILAKDIELTASQYKELEDLLLKGGTREPVAAGSEGEILLTKEEAGIESGFFYYVPKSYKPDQPHPLILFMHGGEFEKMGPYPRWRAHLKEILGWMLTGGMGEDYLIAVPATPEGYAKESWRRVVFATMRKMKEKFRVDDNRILLGGGSMGAFGVWEAALFHGDRLAGIIPCSGGYSYDDWLPNCRNMGVLLAHGAKDPVCQPENSRNNHAKLKDLGIPTLYKEFPKNGHAIPYWDVFKQAREWFKDRPRQPYPKRLTWLAPDPAFFPTSANADRWFWLTVTGKEKNASIDAEIGAENTIALTTKGVTALKIRLNDRLIDMEKPVNIVVNGKSVKSVKVPRSARFLIGGCEDFLDRGMLFANEIDVVIP